MVMGAADEIALGLYRQLRSRSAEATGDEASVLETQCVANIATFVRDVASNIGAPDVRERFSGRLEGFQMHRSDASFYLCGRWGHLETGAQGRARRRCDKSTVCQLGRCLLGHCQPA